MNKRIKELADQIEEMYKLPSERELAIEKFAELIVRECAQFIFVLDAEPVSHKSAARMLQDHFGINT